MKMRFRTILLILLLSAANLLAAPEAGGPEISFQAHTDRTKMTIGDNLTYGLLITMPQGFILQKPEESVDLGKWEVRDSSFTVSKTDKNQYELSYVLTTFSTGTVTIPEITLSYTDNNDHPGRVNSKSLDITVESVLDKMGDSGDIRDIKPPLGLRPGILEYLKWLLLLGLVSAAVYFIYNKYLKKKITEIQQNTEPEIPPEAAALDALEKLKSSTLIADGKIKEFYITLSEIVRTFLGTVYKVDTLDRTTGEIYSQLKAAEPDKKALAFMKDFLEECDLVKFAKYTPEEKEIWQDFDTAKKIVSEIKGEGVS